MRSYYEPEYMFNGGLALRSGIEVERHLTWGSHACSEPTPAVDVPRPVVSPAQLTSWLRVIVKTHAEHMYISWCFLFPLCTLYKSYDRQFLPLLSRSRRPSPSQPGPRPSPVRPPAQLRTIHRPGPER